MKKKYSFMGLRHFLSYKDNRKGVFFFVAVIGIFLFFMFRGVGWPATSAMTIFSGIVIWSFL